MRFSNAAKSGDSSTDCKSSTVCVASLSAEGRFPIKQTYLNIDEPGSILLPNYEGSMPVETEWIRPKEVSLAKNWVNKVDSGISVSIASPISSYSFFGKGIE